MPFFLYRHCLNVTRAKRKIFNCDIFGKNYPSKSRKKEKKNGKLNFISKIILKISNVNCSHSVHYECWLFDVWVFKQNYCDRHFKQEIRVYGTEGDTYTQTILPCVSCTDSNSFIHTPHTYIHTSVHYITKHTTNKQVYS